MSQERAEAYFVVVQYLERVAAFEQMLLELVTFQAMLHSSHDAKDQNLFVLSPKFALTHRLSKEFFLDYLSYVTEKSCIRWEITVAALSSPPFVDLLRDDEALLSFMGDFWDDELPVVFKNNPAFYQRMHPALWMRLCEKTTLYIDIVIRDSRIYQTLTSEQLLELLLKGDKFFELYQEDSTKIPPLLKRLEARDLFRLSNKLILDSTRPLFVEVQRELSGRFLIMSLLELEAFKKDFPASRWKHLDPELQETFDRMLSYKRQAEEDLRQRKQSEQSATRPVTPPPSPKLVLPSLLALYPVAPQTVARPAPFVPARVPPATLVKPVVVSSANASPTILKRASIAARWKALPLKWKLLAGILVLLGIAAIVAAAVFCPPSLAVTLPVAGKVAVSTLVVAGGGTVVVTTLLGHGIHTVRTSPVSGASEQTEPAPKESAPAAPAKETQPVSDPLAFQGLRDLEQSALVSALKSSEPLSRTASKNVDVFAEGQRRASGLQQPPPAEVAESEELFYCP